MKKITDQTTVCLNVYYVEGNSIDMMSFTTLNFFNVDDEYRMKYSSHAEVEAGGIIGIIGFCVFLFLYLLLDS